MFRTILSTAIAVSLGAILGCGPDSGRKQVPIVFADQGRADQAMTFEAELRKLDHTDLDFENAPVRDVVKAMQEKFRCRIEMTRLAAEYVSESDVKVTARVEAIPADLAFAVMRAELELKGLVLVSRGNALGRPAFTLERSRARELTGGAPAKGATDF